MNNKKVIASAIFSAAGLILLAIHEGFSPTPYIDTGGVITNGFGNANRDAHKTVTVVQALEDLKINASSAGQAVSKCVLTTMTQNQYDAYVSFAYNIGNRAFCNSTMVRKANAGDAVGSCNEFKRWQFVAGKDCRIASSNCSGIVKRRKAELALCLHGL